jgi:NitT/TauT family transport system permease protein
MRASARIYPLALLTALLLVWEVAVRRLHIPAYLLPTPSAAGREVNRELLGHAWVTFYEAGLGFVLANVLAFLAAVLFVHCPPVEKTLFPLAIALKTTPLVALAPLLVIWFGSGLWSKVAASVLICFFPVLVNSVKGLKTVEPEARELFAAYGASAWELFWRLRLPASLPYVLAGLKISTSLAVVGAIVGEFVGANEGLGYVILLASYHLETPAMFSAIFCAAAIGLAMFWAVGFAERKIVFWQRVDQT